MSKRVWYVAAMALMIGLGGRVTGTLAATSPSTVKVVAASSPYLTLSAVSGVAGQRIQASGRVSGNYKLTVGYLVWDSRLVVDSFTMSGGSGNFLTQFTVPAAAAGNHTVTVVAGGVNQAQATFVVTSTVTSTPSPTPSPTSPPPTATPSPTQPTPTAPPTTSGPQPNGPTGTWNLMFDDEFQGTAVDAGKWYATCPWSGGTPLCSAGDGSLNCFDPSRVTEGNGLLDISAQKLGAPLSCGGKTDTYEGGWIDTSHWNSPTDYSFTYGYMEASIKMPNSADGPGIWPGFWSGTVSGAWPPEIDVVEWSSNQPDSASLHYHYPCATGACQAGTVVNLGTDLSQGWHTYGVDWEPNSLTWYIDGKPVYTFTGPTPNVPMDLRLSLEVCGNSYNLVSPSTVFPADMQVSDVRVWQH
ncbi:MAG TPA: glycoside hydrolase family 16 protein [Chloroflexota bacterium]|nr:glycoside hydrolase family 16 protein [Chloroflexota bacterium]